MASLSHFAGFPSAYIHSKGVQDALQHEEQVKPPRRPQGTGSDRKQDDDETAFNPTLAFEARKAQQDAADVAATLSHTVQSGLEDVDDALSAEVLSKAAGKTASEFDELVLKPRVKLLKLQAPSLVAAHTDLESKFDDSSPQGKAVAAAASMKTGAMPSRWSPVAMLRYLLRTDPVEAIAMMEEFNSSLQSGQSTGSPVSSEVINGVVDCLTGYVLATLDEAAVEDPSLLSTALVTLCNALFLLPTRAHELLAVVEKLTCTKLTTLSVDPAAIWYVCKLFCGCRSAFIIVSWMCERCAARLRA